MITTYKINKNELIINLKFNDCKTDYINTQIFYTYINFLIRKKRLNFNGKKIIIYVNNIYIGDCYLTRYYLKIIFKNKKIRTVNETNSYFLFKNILEINSTGQKELCI